jgi:hypothetical protein
MYYVACLIKNVARMLQIRTVCSSTEQYQGCSITKLLGCSCAEQYQRRIAVKKRINGVAVQICVKNVAVQSRIKSTVLH